MAATVERAIALLPFFAFNWWFTFVDPVFTWLGLLDAVGNVVMLALCVVGWWRVGASTQSRSPNISDTT